MLQRVRVGLVGAGQMSHFAARAFARHPQAELVAVADPSAERAQQLAAAFGLAIEGDVRRLLERRDVDAVYIASPNVHHAPQALMALELGKHVLVEKPFAMNHAEAAEVVDSARRAGKVLSLCMNQRFEPETSLLFDWVRSGALGRVYHAKAQWLRRAGIPRLGTWFGDKRLAGGGALLDIGVHLLDLALYLMDDFEPCSISGVTHSAFGARGQGEGGWGQSERVVGAPFDVEDFALGWLRFPSGASLQLEVSWALHQGENERRSVELFGEEGGARLTAAGAFCVDGGPAERPLGPAEGEPESPQSNFIEHVLGREPLLVSPQQALAVQRILDAIYASAQSGREEQLSWT